MCGSSHPAYGVYQHVVDVDLDFAGVLELEVEELRLPDVGGRVAGDGRLDREDVESLFALVAPRLAAAQQRVPQLRHVVLAFHLHRDLIFAVRRTRRDHDRRPDALRL